MLTQRKTYADDEGRIYWQISRGFAYPNTTHMLVAGDVVNEREYAKLAGNIASVAPRVYKTGVVVFYDESYDEAALLCDDSPSLKYQHSRRPLPRDRCLVPLHYGARLPCALCNVFEETRGTPIWNWNPDQYHGDDACDGSTCVHPSHQN